MKKRTKRMNDTIANLLRVIDATTEQDEGGITSNAWEAVIQAARAVEASERQPEGNTEVLQQKLLRAKLPPEVLSRIDELDHAQQVAALPELIATAVAVVQLAKVATLSDEMADRCALLDIALEKAGVKL
jgi:hypothetical protein